MGFQKDQHAKLYNFSSIANHIEDSLGSTFTTSLYSRSIYYYYHYHYCYYYYCYYYHYYYYCYFYLFILGKKNLFTILKHKCETKLLKKNNSKRRQKTEFHSATLVRIFWRFTVFLLQFMSPQVKRDLISSIKKFVYNLPHEFPIELRQLVCFILYLVWFRYRKKTFCQISDYFGYRLMKNNIILMYLLCVYKNPLF